MFVILLLMILTWHLQFWTAKVDEAADVASGAGGDDDESITMTDDEAESD
jgi:hypothetical protein